MTVADKFKHSRALSTLFVLGMAFSIACSTTPKSDASPESPQALVSGPLKIQGELSSLEVVDGSVILVHIRLPQGATDGAISGKFEEIGLPFFKTDENTYQAVLGVPFNHKPGSSNVVVKFSALCPEEAGSGCTREPQVLELPVQISDGQYPSETLRVDSKHVNPEKKYMARIQRERAKIGEIYRRITREKYWEGPFQLPIQSPITSQFGTKRVFNGELRGFHGGLDLKAAPGTLVHAAASGLVALSKNLFYTGNTVILDHGYGIFTVYAHLSRLKVREGNQVKMGDLLGLSGKTGRVTGPHLHWQAVIHREKVNPIELTKVMR